jgi:hypothetical protein
MKRRASFLNAFVDKPDIEARPYKYISNEIHHLNNASGLYLKQFFLVVYLQVRAIKNYSI